MYIWHPTLKTWLQIPWHSSQQEAVSTSPPLEPGQAPHWVGQQHTLSDALWSLMLNHKRPFGLCPVGWNPCLEPRGCHTLQGSSKYRKRLVCMSSAEQTQRSPLSGHPSPGIRGELQKPPDDSSPQPFKTLQGKDSEESTSFVYCPKIYNQNLIVKKKSKQIILKNNWPTYFEKYQYQASLMVQWLKIHLPIPGTWVWSHVAAELVCHDSWSLCA